MLSPSLSPPLPLLKISIANPPSSARRRSSFCPPSASVNTAYKGRTNPNLNSNGMSSSCGSFYQILGIPAVATNQEIKSAYRKLARTCHPDVAGVERKDSSADEFIRIHAAYSTLSDPEKRAVYDRKLFRRSRPLTVSGFSGYSGRNWETDQCW